MKRPPDDALVPRDELATYFSEIGQYPLLTREEERELAVRVHEKGDPEAAQKLVLSNLRLVVKIAREYQRVWTSLLDLIQEGNVGLLQAVRRFDPHRGVKLSSYAAYWIRAYILKYLIDNIRMVRVGGSRAERKLFFQMNRARRELERAGFAPEPKLLAESLDVNEREVEDMERRLAQSDLSLDMPATDEPGSASFGDFIASSQSSSETLVGDRAMRENFRRHVERFSESLDEREQKILRERVLADEPRTLRELGEEFGLTRERVRQIEKKIVDRLREYFKENLVDFDYYAPDV
ncbi:MAG: RNA polymerase sigma factor RpoD/SigA [Myxococcota bacterium]